MISKIRLSLSIVLVAILLVAIGQIVDVRLSVNQFPRRLELGAYSVSDSPGCKDSSTHQKSWTHQDGRREQSYRYRCGDTSILIHGQRLIVNGRAYPYSESGGSITVDWGRVTVKPRRVPISSAAL
jgi:hypothetical protein